MKLKQNSGVKIDIKKLNLVNKSLTLNRINALKETGLNKITYVKVNMSHLINSFNE